jgi:hypothetical protein
MTKIVATEEVKKTSELKSASPSLTGMKGYDLHC